MLTNFIDNIDNTRNVTGLVLSRKIAKAFNLKKSNA